MHLAILVLASLAGGPLPAPARLEGVDLIVAQDGGGDFTTIQAALDALPESGRRTRVVLVRRGVYREKIFVTKSRVAIVGEDRAKTRIEFSVLRREWRKTHPDDLGAAVVNVGDDVTDLILANLTIRNDYGSTHDDHDHQFAIRSGGRSTRIVLLHANLIADGGDTVSLWNSESGMSYHASCSFEGWVDFVCPRGSSFVTNSRFFGRSPTAAIWHDGSKDRDHRFVVRSSRFDGAEGFPLGRNNRDGQFYLLDDVFSPSMADRPIYQPSAPESYAWEPRAFFDNCHGDDGDRPWFADNLKSADFSPAPAEITAEWTFCGQWDPEGTMPAVLPFAAVPRPRDGAWDVPLFGVPLRWVAGRGASAHELFLGTGPDLPLVSRLPGTSHATGPLAPGTTYSWRVDAIGPGGRVRGETWHFTTAARPTRIALAGDSTVTDRQGWGPGFAARLREGALCVNLSLGGRSTKSYVEEGHWEEALAARPDFVLIQFGHNDAPGKGPDRETDARTTYRENLARMVDEARAAGIRPVLVTSLTRRYVDEAGCVRSDLVDYAEAAKAVAFERRVPVVDLHRISIEAIERMSPAEVVALGVPKEDGTLDRTHLSAAGAALFGGLVAEELARVVPELAPAFATRPSTTGPAAGGSAGPAGRDLPDGMEGGRVVLVTAPSREAGVAGVRSLAPLLERPAAFYSTVEAAGVGENVLLFQRSNGGWPKNVDMVRTLDAPGKVEAARHGADSDTTIDNGATYTQVRFLSRLFAATRDERFRAGALAGLHFLLAAQYRNGGWPQFFPLRTDYSRHVTFNDGAMAGTLALLRDVSRGEEPFAFVDGERRSRAAGAVDRGVRAILAAQVVSGGRRTAWCAQNDAVTLAPRPARAFEPVALASSESVGVVELLMSLTAPSSEVVAAIDDAVAWLRSVKIEGLRVERRTDPSAPRGFDVVATPDAAAPAVWARFYEVGTNRPLFAGRDGVVRARLDEIERERRIGYAWYGTWPETLLTKEYPAWKAKHPSEVP